MTFGSNQTLRGFVSDLARHISNRLHDVTSITFNIFESDAGTASATSAATPGPSTGTNKSITIGPTVIRLSTGIYTTNENIFNELSSDTNPNVSDNVRSERAQNAALKQVLAQVIERELSTIVVDVVFHMTDEQQQQTHSSASSGTTPIQSRGLHVDDLTTKANQSMADINSFIGASSRTVQCTDTDAASLQLLKRTIIDKTNARRTAMDVSNGPLFATNANAGTDPDTLIKWVDSTADNNKVVVDVKNLRFGDEETLNKLALRYFLYLPAKYLSVTEIGQHNLDARNGDVAKMNKNIDLLRQKFCSITMLQ